MAPKSQKAINRGAARFIPLLLIAIVSYSSWVVVNLCGTVLFSYSWCKVLKHHSGIPLRS